MSKNQTVHDFDENFFSSIAVPKAKDYSRLSSSPSRDQPCESSYFEKHFPNLECDTPVKMRLPAADRESGDALPVMSMSNFLSSSSGSEHSTVTEQQPAPQQQQQAPPQREPLKIKPVAPPQPKEPYGENQLIEGIEKLTMFAPKAPEERLSQRRRSEMKKKQEEETKRRSVMNITSGTAASTGRVRSISVKRSVSREPSAASRAPSVPRSRHNSVTRTISAPTASAASATGVVTRSMARAAEAATTVKAPLSRRSAMPLKIAPKTPVTTLKKEVVAGGDRSRDRTRRTNTTGASSASRRTIFAGEPIGASTPIAPPRRSASANKAATPSGRPIATANRSSMLRMSAVKPTLPQTAPTTAAPVSKPMVARPEAAVAGGSSRNRMPLRVNPITPTAAPKKPVPAVPAQTRQPPVLRSRSVDRQGQQQPPVATGTPRLTGQKVSRDEVFSRLAMPKGAVTPSRASHDGPHSSLRKSAIRPVPSYVHSVTKSGLPSSGGLHGIRAPSKERSAPKSSQQQ